MSIAISLHLTDKKVYIIGGGNVALRKACAYHKEGANLTIIAPKVKEEIMALTQVRILLQAFSWDFIEDAFMIYVATNDACLNREIVIEAKCRGILCGCANHLADASFSSMKQADYTHFQVAVSTNATFPYANHVFLSALHPQVVTFNQKVASLQIIRKHVLSQKEQVDANLWERLMALSPDDLITLQQAILRQKKLVILAYHGLADMEKASLDMRAMRTLCEGDNILSIDAFISEKIHAKARRKGFEIETLSTLTNLFDKLNLPYVIQPMLVSNGVFMKRIEHLYAHKSIGKVLCDTMHDVQELTSYLIQHSKSPLCLFYHKSDGELAEQLKQQNLYAFRYDEEVPTFAISALTLQSFSIFVGYHAYKDIEQTWVPQLHQQGIQAVFTPCGLLSYEVVRLKFMERIHTIV